jgi:hypothetical protein
MSAFSFTTGQLDHMVELFSILLYDPRIEAISIGGPHVQTSPGIGRGGGPMPTEDQIRALVLADGARVTRIDADGREEVIDPVEIVLVSYSDIRGTVADAANVRALARIPGVTIVRSVGHGGARAQVRLGELSAFTSEGASHDPSRDHRPDPGDAITRLDQLVDAMTSTLEELYIDENMHVEYLIELAEAAWDAWIRFDLPGELRQVARDLDVAVPDDALSPDGGRYDTDDLDRYVDDLFDAYDDKLRAAYYDYGSNEWVAETATSVINARHGQAVRYAAHMVFGWPALP